MQIQQGDQYAIPFSIKQGNTVITPQNCDNVKISFCGKTKDYVRGELTFNTTTNVWEYPLTEAQTKNKNLYLSNYQVAIKIGTDIIYSEVSGLSIAMSEITEDW